LVTSEIRCSVLRLCAPFTNRGGSGDEAQVESNWVRPDPTWAGHRSCGRGAGNHRHEGLRSTGGPQIPQEFDHASWRAGGDLERPSTVPPCCDCSAPFDPRRRSCRTARPRRSLNDGLRAKVSKVGSHPSCSTQEHAFFASGLLILTGKALDPCEHDQPNNRRRSA
jgi:hypothetical protein